MFEGQKKRFKAEVATARQFYLFGQGDGKRVLGVPELARLSKLTEGTIRIHLKGWQKESEEILSQSCSSTLGLVLSSENVQVHKQAMSRLQTEMQQVSWELDNHDDIISTLGDMVNKFLDTDESDTAIKLLDRYLRTTCNKQTLRSQFLALQRQWVKLSGVESLMDVAVTREKTLAVGKAKMELSAGENDTNLTAPVRTGVFAKRIVDELPDAKNPDE